MMGHRLGAAVATCGELLDPIETVSDMAAVAAVFQPESSAPAMEHDGVVPALLVISSRPDPAGCRACG